MLEKTLITLLLTMRHAEDKLGPYHGLDAEGVKLKHDVRNVLALLQLAEQYLPPPDEFIELVDKAMELHERVVDHVLNRHRPPRAPPERTSGPPAAIVARIAEAQAGPDAVETLETCPACINCTLCHDLRWVPVPTAVQWRKRNAPRA